MTLLFTLFPYYLLGNFHCLGMCGPLVMMIGHHRYRWFYFIGRLSSFSLAGALAGELGGKLTFFLESIFFPEFTTFLFGSLLILLGLSQTSLITLPKFSWLKKKISFFEKKIPLLIMKDEPFATFLFGFLTVTLPCGQTAFVFSMCALSESFTVGIINGFAFALLTSPSLFLAMKSRGMLKPLQNILPHLFGYLAIIMGILAFFRGFANLELISHFVLNNKFHIVIF